MTLGQMALEQDFEESGNACLLWFFPRLLIIAGNTRQIKWLCYGNFYFFSVQGVQALLKPLLLLSSKVFTLPMDLLPDTFSAALPRHQLIFVSFVSGRAFDRFLASAHFL